MSYSSQFLTKQRRDKCGSCSTCQESSNRCQTTQFKVACPSNIGDMCIPSKMMNADSESDAESDADTESVVADESADSVVWDAAKPDARLRTRCHLETCQTMLVVYGNQGGDG